MSKSITVPSDRGNPVIVEVNGVRHIYTAGATVTVPDEVAEALANSEAMKPVTGGPGMPLKASGLLAGEAIPVYVQADGTLVIRKSDVAEVAATVKELPAVTGDDEGKVLTVVDGKWAAALTADENGAQIEG